MIELLLIGSFSFADTGLEQFLEAISFVESNHNDNAIGDNGKAIGRYQIHKAYWIDARMNYGGYQNVKDSKYSRQVMLRYWKRYCPKALANRDYQHLARVHNGGPKGHLRKCTLYYWHKVERELNVK